MMRKLRESLRASLSELWELKPTGNKLLDLYHWRSWEFLHVKGGVGVVLLNRRPGRQPPQLVGPCPQECSGFWNRGGEEPKVAD